jgi:hypothetical protein
MRYQLGSALLILTSLCGLRVGAGAETHREVTVNIPYVFVAGGRTLPAGTYAVSRPADEAKVRFERVGDIYYLSSIETLEGVYTVSLPHAISVLARSKHGAGTSASGMP